LLAEFNEIDIELPPWKFNSGFRYEGLDYFFWFCAETH
jgi:hypothetical protein